jgi:hypothetical protein
VQWETLEPVDQHPYPATKPVGQHFVWTAAEKLDVWPPPRVTAPLTNYAYDPRAGFPVDVDQEALAEQLCASPKIGPLLGPEWRVRDPTPQATRYVPEGPTPRPAWQPGGPYVPGRAPWTIPPATQAGPEQQPEPEEGPEPDAPE